MYKNRLPRLGTSSVFVLRESTNTVLARYIAYKGIGHHARCLHGNFCMEIDQHGRYLLGIVCTGNDHHGTFTAREQLPRHVFNVRYLKREPSGYHRHPPASDHPSCFRNTARRTQARLERHYRLLHTFGVLRMISVARCKPKLRHTHTRNIGFCDGRQENANSSRGDFFYSFCFWYFAQLLPKQSLKQQIKAGSRNQERKVSL